MRKLKTAYLIWVNKKHKKKYIILNQIIIAKKQNPEINLYTKGWCLL